MDFERLFDRKKDGSIKWNKYSEDILPMWVADMDFEVAPAIKESLLQYVQTGIYGYAAPNAEHAAVVKDWLFKQYHWEIQKEWIVWLPSVLSGIGTTARLISSQPYAVMTSIPVYRPFIDFAEGDGRYLQAVPLKLHEDKWTMDFEAMENMVTEDTKMYILCNPHNPTGRMYNEVELQGLIDFCERHDILLCSDEIHADIILEKGRKHVPVASLNESAALRTVSLFSAAKAFNIPALNSAFAVIPNAEIRRKFERTKLHTVPNLYKQGADAMLAAYRDSEEWLSASLDYLRSNYAYLYSEIQSIPGLKMLPMEATYLAWIDYSGLGVDTFADILEKHGVGAMEASIFMGEKHIRLNFGTQRFRLEQAVARIKEAVAHIKTRA
jgi:cystathionine beta-lyase